MQCVILKFMQDKPQPRVIKIYTLVICQQFFVGIIFQNCVDYIYIVGMNTSSRSQLCSNFQNFRTSDESDSLKIGPLSIKAFVMLCVMAITFC